MNCASIAYTGKSVKPKELHRMITAVCIRKQKRKNIRKPVLPRSLKKMHPKKRVSAANSGIILKPKVTTDALLTVM